ncbi:MAG: TIGR02450 family Trp-rich protein [Gammaproteobacteria bacterium]|nr:TIGR02450 family Trp-rich protein [Gammaproteobacteria bacterium]
MNKINPGKLLNSKWTAANPVNDEKHFLVTKLEFDKQDMVVLCLIEAVVSKRSSAIEWKDLENSDKWIQGWK